MYLEKILKERKKCPGNVKKTVLIWKYRQYVKKESDLFSLGWEIHVKKFREKDVFHQIFVF